MKPFFAICEEGVSEQDKNFLHNVFMRERPYAKLVVWKEAHMLCKAIYAATMTFPTSERYCLAQQMRRSSYSVPMNIAEGNTRRTKKDHRRFIDIALGSLEELHYQCLLALELRYIDTGQANRLDSHMQRVGYLLNKLRTALLEARA